ncbi:MAG: oligosaccharide repeat unit polymerase [Myxococcota bacterium]
MKQSVAVPLFLFAAILMVGAFAYGMLFVSEIGEVDLQSGGLIVAYAVMAFGLFVFSYFKLVSARIGLFMLLATHVVWFAYPAIRILSDPLRTFGDNAHYRLAPEVIAKTALILILFLGLNLVAYFVTVWKPKPMETPDDGLHLRPLVPYMRFTLPFLVVVGLLPFVIYGNSLGEIVSGIMAGRTTGKAWSHGAHVVSSVGPIVVIARSAAVTFAALGIWQYAFRKHFSLTEGQATAIFAMALLLLLVTYFDSGTRTWTLLIVAPALFSLLLSRLSRGRLVRGTIVGGVAFIAALALVQIQSVYRFQATINEADASQLLQIDDNDFFTETAIAIDLVPRFGYVEQFEPILYITNPIPRFLWENKPIPMTLRAFSSGRSGFDEYVTTGVSRMPSVVGQYYMSWGIWGVVGMGLFWGWMMGAFEKLYRRSEPHSLGAFVGILGLVFLFGSGRGLYPGFHYPLVFGGVLLWLSSRSDEVEFDVLDEDDELGADTHDTRRIA